MISLAFLIAALVCFILGAGAVPTGRINIVAAGLACVVASMLVPKL
jgi:hypothetical protein